MQLDAVKNATASLSSATKSAQQGSGQIQSFNVFYQLSSV